MRKIEVCCTSVADVVEAQKGGACRVELCSALSGGGVTPSYALIKKSVEVGIPVNVLIRPREGDFCYSDEEVEIMLDDIRMAASLGVNGFAIGALNKSGDVDIAVVKRMIEEIRSCTIAGRSVDITFHRAFDECENKERSLEKLIFLGCNRLLTSGGCKSAWTGQNIIKSLVECADGRISIMPGAGVNPDNIAELEKSTRASEYHSSARGAKAKEKEDNYYADGLFGAKPIGVSADVVCRLVNGRI